MPPTSPTSLPKLIAVTAAILTTASAAAGPVRYLNTRNVSLSYRSRNDAPIEAVHVWVSRDAGHTWSRSPVAPAGYSAVLFVAPEDGHYDFYLVLENNAGRSATAPTESSPPHVTVVVDTRPPLLQVHRAQLQAPQGDRRKLRIAASLIEENLLSDTVRLFYRIRPDHNWHDAGAFPLRDGRLLWPIPDDLSPGTYDLRIVVTDRAGNTSANELPDVRIPAAQAPGPAADAANATQTLQSESPESQATTPRASTPVDQGEADAQSATFDLSLADAHRNAEQRVQRLLRHAELFAESGQLPLAVDRYKQALDLQPHNPDLLVGLGQTQLYLQNTDDARDRFQAALDAAPHHVGALEGLALVAGIEGRYAQGRDFLRQILDQRPNSAEHLLRYGDAEHRLGNRAQAIAAWDQALDIPELSDELREKIRTRLKYFARREFPELANHGKTGARPTTSADRRDLRRRAVSKGGRAARGA